MELRTAHYGKNYKNIIEMKIDDVVLVKDDKLPRQMWKLGIIKEIILGRDGKTRACMVKTANNTTIRRSILHLCNLEIRN